MKKLSILSVCFTLLIFASCTKPTSNGIGTATEQQMLTDFAGKLANPNYQDIQAKANIMNQAIITLSTSQTDANLATAQLSWRNTRTAWESCEGYLFGPVEDNDYDPNTDTWPLDKTSLDSLLASSNTLSVSDIDALPITLKGYHAIEYVIFGVGGQRTASQITPRMMTYLVSLGQSLYNTTTALRNSWDPASGNFSAQVVNAGIGSTYFTTRKAALLAIVKSMSDICDEVSSEKMQDPLGASIGSADSTQDESSFSHNSTADFTHNILGIQNAYLCTYNGNVSGHSLHQFVAQNNIFLDNQLTTAINTAVTSFSHINSDYEIAIYDQSQRGLILQTQSDLTNLKALLDGPLHDYIVQYVHD